MIDFKNTNSRVEIVNTPKGKLAILISGVSDTTTSEEKKTCHKFMASTGGAALLWVPLSHREALWDEVLKGKFGIYDSPELREINSVVVLVTELLEIMSPKERAAAFYHEYAHYLFGHAEDQVGIVNVIQNELDADAYAVGKVGKKAMMKAAIKMLTIHRLVPIKHGFQRKVKRIQKQYPNMWMRMAALR